ncbi:UNVERIFIED_CONTAM: hypothetical protein K2H54_018775 [Gekko kuhli]
MPVAWRTGPLLSSVVGSFARLLRSQRRTCSAASTTQPVVAAKEPFRVDLQAGKRYAWCACGHSKKQECKSVRLNLYAQQGGVTKTGWFRSKE